MADPLAALDATAQAELVRRREASPQELVDAAIARIERVDSALGSVIHPAFEAARTAARGRLEGPFAGVPILMKDIGGGEAGRPYNGGMRFLKDAGWREREDSYLTRKLKAAGLVSLGRTSTPELALLPTTEPEAFGPTRNPWQTTHSAGGSSGGAAAAVAAGLVPVAHASDGGGSIRIPASHCAVVGLKPTRGRNSFGPGLGERWNGFSAEFVVTRSVRDAAALLDVTSGQMPGDPYVAPPPARPYAMEIGAAAPRLRIGYMRRAPRGVPLDPQCLEAVDRMAKVLAGLGHAVEESHPEALDEQESVLHYVTVVSTNVARALDAWSAKVGKPIGAGDVETLTWALAERGRGTSGADLLATLEYVHAFGRRLAVWWEGGFDLLLTPSVGAPPPEIGYLTSTPDEPLRAFIRAAPYGVFTAAFNMSGQPAISLPAHWTPEGLPIGTQLVARYAREDVLLGVAAQIEQAAPWASRRPSVHA
ncbi:MAG: amidase [Candidatus Binatia bacterium]